MAKPANWSQAKIAEVAMRQQIREHIVAVLVPRCRRRARIPADHNFERWIRRIAGEIFVGINLELGRMIDRQQLYLIEIHGLFERLHEAETELAIFFSNGLAINLDVFRRSRNVALAGANPVSDHSSAEHVPN